MKGTYLKGTNAIIYGCKRTILANLTCFTLKTVIISSWPLTRKSCKPSYTTWRASEAGLTWNTGLTRSHDVYPRNLHHSRPSSLQQSTDRGEVWYFLSELFPLSAVFHLKELWPFLKKKTKQGESSLLMIVSSSSFQWYLRVSKFTELSLFCLGNNSCNH